MKKVYTALVTLFKDNQIDYLGMKMLIDSMLLDGVDGFIVCGTTAESPVLNEQEKFELLSFVVDYCKQKCEIYFGCGTNNTKETIRLCQKAEKYEIDGLLLVTPYYNKPSQNGLFAHFHEIDKYVHIPIMLYEVKSRCVVEFSVDTLKRLCNECKNIKYLKYASSDMEKLKCIKKECPDLLVFCGDDSMIAECDILNADGVVSVISHLYLKEIKAFYKTHNLNDVFFLKRYSNLLFKETNPVCVKYVLSKYYPVSCEVRLPLTQPCENTKKILDRYFDRIY